MRVSRVRRVRNQVVASRRPAAFPKLLPEFCWSHEKRLGQTLAAALVCLNVHLHVWLACVCCHGPTHTSRHIAQLGAPETETLVLLLHINNPPSAAAAAASQSGTSHRCDCCHDDTDRVDMKTSKSLHAHTHTDTHSRTHIQL